MTGARADLDAAIAVIRSGPQGRAVAAVFDFGAVVDGPAPRRRRKPADVLLRGLGKHMTDGEYSRLLRELSVTLAGRSAPELTELGRRLFKRTVYGYLYPEAWQLIRTHQAAGHTVVLVSSLTEFQVTPAAAHLGIEHVLFTPMAARDGVLTGYPDGKPLWGNGKAEAVAEFAAAHEVDLERSYAYAGTSADLPLLSQTGHPVAVNPDDALAEVADRQHWGKLTFRPRRPPRAGDYARTAAGFAGLLGGALFGVASKAPTKDRQQMADALMAHAARNTLRIAGVHVRVTGAENAKSPRPAVFLFNHQSQFDIIIVPEVLGGGVTAIGKKELTKNPIFGPLMRFVGVTFIDRSNSARARAALRPVVETLRGGLSVAVSPEGTRSYTPEVGLFKKGAFHIAMQAGVPVIPVVIRNAGEICWRNAMVARPGTVDVAILDPIDVSAWNPADLDENVAQVRQLFIDTLLDWPR
ncbi:HAD-IB family hydrolase [Nocardia gipuzkoensis]|uniref:HAD-IB family hydrolase n=1 Tax=Nocardia gipuzkoensis TaxID=2749991 RepID=UPI001E427FBF|nr:HAD-IB family hydrolase [Nocardia gipuzkoensis]UGT71570.1 HAD-IB family hydrolase [Nocardia gipuzkoensis]